MRIGKICDKVLEEHHMSPEVIRFSDMITAQNAGVKGVGVTWGFRDAKSLKESGADFLVDTPAQLLDIAQNTECETAL